MKVAICQVEVSPQGARLGQVKALGAWWVQFGDKALLLAAKPNWDRVASNAERSGLFLEEFPDDIRKEDMHLVVQKGRLFQKEYPTIPVLLDKGRYLVVKLSPKEAKKIGVRKEPCFVIQPLKENTVVFDVRIQPAKRIQPVAWIQDLVDEITRSGFETTLHHLLSYLTRYSTSSHYTDAATWSREQLDSMGYSTSIESIPVNGGTSCNVIAEKLGASSGSRELVLVVAHLDSINTSGGPSASAPGADDNASGSAGLLKMAEILKDHPLVHDLRLVLFGGEEQGLDGSTQYVNNLSTSERSRIRVIVNMDMIGTLNTSEPTVLLEGSTVSQTVIDDLSDMAFTYTSLTVQTSLYPYASDHVPFINAGLPAVLTIEGADSANSNIHSAEDTIDHIDCDLALEILRMNVAYVGAKIEKKGGSIMDKYATKELVMESIKEYFEKGIRPIFWQLSGRYNYNQGASARVGLTTRSSRYGYPIALTEDPIYSVEDIVYSEEYQSWEFFKLRFTLHIDIDGTHPLNVVSGTVARPPYRVGARAPHFVGRVTSNTFSGGIRNLVVEGLNFQWPGSTDTIDRLEIALSGWLYIKPTADVTFIDTSRNHQHGPYSVEQESIYFHDIEVEIDSEDNAVDVEPYNTHTHPDRPADLPEENLTIEKTFAKAGIRITRSSESNVINTTDVPGGTWSKQELHDAMEDHWSAFANRPQWKMWILLAELAEDARLGGVMFDGRIDEPGGVDRQGTAIFTTCPWFHSTTGGYIVDNPPETEAVQRELFFNFIHETGHAFNLAHSFQKQSVYYAGDAAWTPPDWMPLISDPEALSWMNYPERATQSATDSVDYNATWFYNRFRFRFIDDELLFLRHAPASYVEMGNEEWFQNHGRVSQSSLDRRLELVMRGRKKIVELGEPVFLELRLRNISDKTAMVHRNLDPMDGFVEVAVVNPRGERHPFIPFMHTRTRIHQQMLEPGQALYHSVNLTIGQFGFPFKEPGPYRVEVSYRNIHGGTAAAIIQLWVRSPANYDDMPVISELFNARIGRVLYVGGSRLMDDVNEKIAWVCDHLSKRHPAKHYLSAVRGMPLVEAYKVLRADSDKVRLLDSEPKNAERVLSPLIENMEAATDSIGHITYRNIVDTYTKSALDTDKKSQALKAQEKLLGMFKKRKVLKTVLESIEQRIKRLK